MSNIGKQPVEIPEGVDVIIHLANIANDPTVELDPTLSWDVNVLFMIRISTRFYTGVFLILDGRR